VRRSGCRSRGGWSRRRLHVLDGLHGVVFYQ
jgi:hypothetical protein